MDHTLCLLCQTSIDAWNVAVFIKFTKRAMQVMEKNTFALASNNILAFLVIKVNLLKEHIFSWVPCGTYSKYYNA